MAERDAGGDAAEDDEGEWRFPLSEFEDDGNGDAVASIGSDGTVVSDPEAADADDSIAPGDPSLEGAVFVLLGMAVALFFLSRPFVG